MSRTATLLSLFAICVAVVVSPAAYAEEISTLVVEPSLLVFSEPNEGRRVLVTGITAGGEKIDLTSEAQFEGGERCRQGR